ncbi:hypothetical protein L9F63_024918, partial [Diploptera punctata]
YVSICTIKEWNVFTGQAVSDVKIESSKVLVIQALRPDRLYSALVQFALEVNVFMIFLPPALSLKQLLPETLSMEPVLLVISPGADPSEELRALAQLTVGDQHYFEVAMGQGQITVALDHLCAAARQGDWLCLKNLHLMTYWLPTLEKELKSLVPHENFRLWFTAEAHLKFSPILAQSCLKVTYESPQGVKKNLQRTYASWGPEFINRDGQNDIRAKAMFALAWFHAVVQERRTFIPQGWAKFYEFSDADIRAGSEILQELFQKDSRKTPLGPGISIPATSNYQAHINAIQQLSDTDKPAYFGLPANVQRSWQRITSREVINKLKALMRSTEKFKKFNREEWQHPSTVKSSLMYSQGSGSGLIQMKVPPISEESAPVTLFVGLEYHDAVVSVQQVHKSLATLSRVIRGTVLPSSDVMQLADSIMSQQTPSAWQKMWEGPEEPVLYLRSLMARALAVQRWSQRSSQGTLLREPVDLSDLFHPDTFLSALKQQTRQEYGITLDELHLACSWSKSGLPGSRLPTTLTALQLEGATFDGLRLLPNSSDSPSISLAPSCTVAWMPKGSSQVYHPKEVISLPLYYNSSRDRVVVSLDVPCGGDQDKWVQTGAAFFLRN